jgi:hypothetical protein
MVNLSRPLLSPVAHTSCRYTFTIDSDQIPGYTGPPLVIENLTTGNEARFVNDKWQHPSGEANVVATVVWDDDKKVPVVGFEAMCSIEEVRALQFLDVAWRCLFSCLSGRGASHRLRRGFLENHILQHNARAH